MPFSLRSRYAPLITPLRFTAAPAPPKGSRDDSVADVPRGASEATICEWCYLSDEAIDAFYRDALILAGCGAFDSTL